MTPDPPEAHVEPDPDPHATPDHAGNHVPNEGQPTPTASTSDAQVREYLADLFGREV